MPQAYEYVRAAITKNMTFLAANPSIGKNPPTDKTHLNGYGDVHRVTAINILTGSVTYSSLQGSGYSWTDSITGVPTDKELLAINDPYRVAGRVTVKGDLSPISYNHGLAH